MSESITEKEDRLVRDNLGLVINIAKSFHPKDTHEYDEFVQIGSIALLKAIRKHDPKRGALSTLAWPYIYYSILRSIKQNNKHQHDILYDNNFCVERLPELWEFLPITLTALEKLVVILRLEYKLTFNEIGSCLGGYTKEWTNKLFKIAIKKIQKANNDA